MGRSPEPLDPRGRASSALGNDLEASREYLRLVAASELARELEPKVGVSDMVQEALLEAVRDASQLATDPNRDPAGLRAWLRTILLNNIRNTVRRYRRTAKRDLAREVPLHQQGSELEDSLSSPSSMVMHQELAGLLETALEHLPDLERRAVLLRTREGYSFEKIGRCLGVSHASARTYWLRGLERLRRELERS
jgi:RNA polymerase sigma-70 factor (subfamily 1)